MMWIWINEFEMIRSMSKFRNNVCKPEKIGWLQKESLLCHVHDAKVKSFFPDLFMKPISPQHSEPMHMHQFRKLRLNSMLNGFFLLFVAQEINSKLFQLEDLKRITVSDKCIQIKRKWREANHSPILLVSFVFIVATCSLSHFLFLPLLSNLFVRIPHCRFALQCKIAVCASAEFIRATD